MPRVTSYSFWIKKYWRSGECRRFNSWRSIRHPLWFYLFSLKVCTVASRVNVWKPHYQLRRVTKQGFTLTQLRSSIRSCNQNQRSYSNIDISSLKDIHISNLCKNKPQGTNNLVQNYNVETCIIVHSKQATWQNIFSSSLLLIRVGENPQEGKFAWPRKGSRRNPSLSSSPTNVFCACYSLLCFAYTRVKKFLFLMAAPLHAVASGAPELCQMTRGFQELWYIYSMCVICQ